MFLFSPSIKRFFCSYQRPVKKYSICAELPIAIDACIYCSALHFEVIPLIPEINIITFTNPMHCRKRMGTVVDNLNLICWFNCRIKPILTTASAASKIKLTSNEIQIDSKIIILLTFKPNPLYIWYQ